MNLIKDLLDLLFPPKCVFCRTLLDNGSEEICPACAEKLLHMECADKSGEFFDTCVAPFPYTDPVRASMLRFKFRGATHYVNCYGELLAACISSRLAGQYDLITWVPISRRRRRKRGYDQTKLLSQALCRRLDRPAIPTLRKIINNPAQSSLDSAEKRRANVLGVYEALKPEQFTQKRILLIDDIVTTGATLSECSRVLLTAGAKEVVCAAFASAQRTDRNDNDAEIDE
ncbi:MAG: ComF family protein [Clostridiales bacterium]|nr:ComF family protein [Clostridiales bacterium]